MPGGVSEKITIPMKSTSDLSFYFEQFAHLGASSLLNIRPNSGCYMLDSDQAKLIKAAFVVAGAEAEKRIAAASMVAAEASLGFDPAMAGPEEYEVKAGDGGAKIAKANKVSLADLQAVNPDVNWMELEVGQKVKLPAKK